MKCTFAIRQMAYGAVPDALDEYLQMGATTSRKSLQMFCKAITELYGEEFLRKLTYTDMEKLYAHHDEKHGFPRMLGSIDSSNDLWIWYAFFGVSGMNHGVNVLRQSSLFNDLKSGKAPDIPFVANNVPYKRGYYLTDGDISAMDNEVAISPEFFREEQHRDYDPCLDGTLEKEDHCLNGTSAAAPMWLSMARLPKNWGGVIGQKGGVRGLSVGAKEDNRWAISPEFFPEEQQP
ncbi:ALP1-like protein [Tanacetum coccineum]